MFQTNASDAPIVALASLPSGRFAYSTASGEVGVYAYDPDARAASRLWRSHSRSRATCLAAYDLDSDGEAELISGWATGRFEARNASTGSLVWRDVLPSAAAGLCACDLRRDGSPLLLVALTDGSLRGYVQSDAETLAALRLSSATGTAEGLDGSGVMFAVDSESQQKAELKDMRLQLSLVPNPDGQTCELQVAVVLATDGVAQPLPAPVRLLSATAFSSAKDLFGPGRDVATAVPPPAQPTASAHALSVPLRIVRNAAATLRVSAVVQAHSLPTAGGSASALGTLEATLDLPRFASFAWLDKNDVGRYLSPQGYVQFAASVQTPAETVAAWVAQSFPVSISIHQMLLQPASEKEAETKLAFEAAFLDVRSQAVVRLMAVPAPDSSTDYTIACDDIATAGDILSSFASHLGIARIAPAAANFPAAHSALEAVVARLEEATHTKGRLTGDSAEGVAGLKTLLLTSEDARLRLDLRTMGRALAEMRGVTGQLVAEHGQRCRSHAALVAALRETHAMITCAAALRAGPPKAEFVAACRASLQANDPAALLHIMGPGSTTL